MKYRRNADSELRARERDFQAEPSLTSLERYNAERLRSGLRLFQEESLANLAIFNDIRTSAGLAILQHLALEFGYVPGLPELITIDGQNYTSTTAAWGARAILEGNQASLLPDRQSIIALNGRVLELLEDGMDYSISPATLSALADRAFDRQMLLEVLNGNPRGTGAIAAAQREVARLSRCGTIDPRQAREVILYDGNLARIVANTNASHGYLYMIGFLKVPGMAMSVVAPETCERCHNELDPGEEFEECRYCHQLICPRCGTRCQDCEKYICEDHEQSECKSCGEVICGSNECNRRGRPSALAKECPKCGEMYCRGCRAEVKNCPCNICEDCGNEIEDCEDCGEPRCSCKGCPCEEQDDEEEEDEEEEATEDDDVEGPRRNPDEDEIEDELDDYDDDGDFELGGWAVVHDSGDLIADGFDSQEEAEAWLKSAMAQSLLEDTIRAYHITETEE